MSTNSSKPMKAYECPNEHITYPGHALCPECGEEQIETVNLSEYTAEVVTWTESTATPPGVREPNTLAIVEFDVDGASVRALGQVAENADVESGDTVKPIPVDELREPGVGLKSVDADQVWHGHRFEPV